MYEKAQNLRFAAMGVVPYDTNRFVDSKIICGCDFCNLGTGGGAGAYIKPRSNRDPLRGQALCRPEMLNHRW